MFQPGAAIGIPRILSASTPTRPPLMPMASWEPRLWPGGATPPHAVAGTTRPIRAHINAAVGAKNLRLVTVSSFRSVFHRILEGTRPDVDMPVFETVTRRKRLPSRGHKCCGWAPHEAMLWRNAEKQDGSPRATNRGGTTPYVRGGAVVVIPERTAPEQKDATKEHLHSKARSRLMAR